MASDYFLLIDGIKGESVDSKHKGEIEVASFSWGVANATSAGAGGGGGAGKATFQDIHFVKNVDVASPALFLSCATGTHIKKATLTVRKAGKEQQDFLKVTMEDILVSSYQQGASGGVETVPTDQFSLNFAKIGMNFQGQNSDGTLTEVQSVGWDIRANRAD